MKINFEIDETVLQVILIALNGAQDDDLGDDVDFTKIEADQKKRENAMRIFEEYNGSPEDFESDKENGSTFQYVAPNWFLGILWRKLHDQLIEAGITPAVDTFDEY